LYGRGGLSQTRNSWPETLLPVERYCRDGAA
jgi:hypothetical protein